MKKLWLRLKMYLVDCRDKYDEKLFWQGHKWAHDNLRQHEMSASQIVCHLETSRYMGTYDIFDEGAELALNEFDSLTTRKLAAIVQS